MTDTEKSIATTIAETINNNPIVLFMKGTRQTPQCGFSAAVVGILNHLAVTYHDINVLSSAELRQGIKDYSQWPTIPQLYIKGEFIGGCDIVREMAQSGELTSLLQKHGLLKQ